MCRILCPNTINLLTRSRAIDLLAATIPSPSNFLRPGTTIAALSFLGGGTFASTPCCIPAETTAFVTRHVRSRSFDRPIPSVRMSISTAAAAKTGVGGMPDPKNTDTRKRKQELRKLVRSRLKSMSQDDIQSQSELVWNNLFSLPEYVSARSVGLFLSMPRGEIITDSALARVLDDNKTLYVPRVGLDFEKCDMDLIKVHVDDKTEGEIAHSKDAARKLFYHDWPRNKWGIPEPPVDVDHEAAKPGDIDLLVVPGLAFDAVGGRLGQGKGYYDRFIMKMRAGVDDESEETKPLLVAVGLEASFLEGEEAPVPMSTHDFPMDVLVLPGRSMNIRI
mmetsp:Transcript_20610/g.45035  ORF Transcript_20610/g.45035 Transcript_20610/m.45035 type:complete len:334 (+) Transcript_20610:34-1035(+)